MRSRTKNSLSPNHDDGRHLLGIYTLSFAVLKTKPRSTPVYIN